MKTTFKLAGLFAGVGGIEHGFQRALNGAEAELETVILCESWLPAQRVLASHFPATTLHHDIRSLRDLPREVDVIAAGFPCTDLSQAGRTAGIGGEQSGLIVHLFEILEQAKNRQNHVPWLFIENVSNMLTLDKGKAMAYLVQELEQLGYRWAYRIVDSRAVGVPQRRRRVLLVASTTDDPRCVLFADDTSGLDASNLSRDAFGFYWTEGRTGLGWAQDATPTLKGGSTVGIPSPPAIWVPKAAPGQKFVTPSIEDAEALQGFERGWTAAADEGRRNGPRWKLVGNAVTVGVAAWAASRILKPGDFCAADNLWTGSSSWPGAAWGENGKVWQVEASEFPVLEAYTHLLDVVKPGNLRPLSNRATAGFWQRLQTSNLGKYPGFRSDIAEHARVTGSEALRTPSTPS